MKIYQNIFISLVIALLIGTKTSVPATAQSLLDNLTFEAPSKLIRAKKDNVKLRVQPSASARQAVDEYGWEEFIYPWQLFNVMQEKNGWYMIKKGCWVKATDVMLAKSLPINMTTMCNRFFGYADGYDFGGEWIVSQPIKGTDYVLFISQGDIPGMINMLRLGKKVGNVFVFKYAINCDLRESQEENVCSLHSESRDGDVFYELTLGQKYLTEMKHGGNGMIPSFNLSLLNAKIVEALFKKVIEAGETDFFYINSELLSGQYANYILG